MREESSTRPCGAPASLTCLLPGTTRTVNPGYTNPGIGRTLASPTTPPPGSIQPVRAHGHVRQSCIARQSCCKGPPRPQHSCPAHSSQGSQTTRRALADQARKPGRDGPWWRHARPRRLGTLARTPPAPRRLGACDSSLVPGHGCRQTGRPRTTCTNYRQPAGVHGECARTHTVLRRSLNAWGAPLYQVSFSRRCPLPPALPSLGPGEDQMTAPGTG